MCFWPKLPQISPYQKQGEVSKIGDSFSTFNNKILYLTSMHTCPPYLTHSLLTVCEITTFKVDYKVFSFMQKGNNRVLEP